MNQIPVRRSVMAAAVLLGLLTASCTKPSANSRPPNPAGPEPFAAGPVVQKPVKLRLLDTSRMPAETFQNVVTEPLLKRQPLLTVESVPYPEGAEWKKLLENESPDLVLVPLPELESPQVTKNWLDLSDIVQEMTNGAEKIRSTEGTYGLLPPGKGASLYFNKEIFDKFGVPYPQEGLTWSETKALTVRLTRVEREIQYQGFAADRAFLLSIMSMLTPLANPQSDRAQFMTESWNPWLTTLKSVYEVPGMEVEGAVRDYGKNRFIKKRDVAMWAGNFIYPPLLPEQQIRVGRIQLPAFDSETSNNAGLPAGYYFAVPKTAKHPKEALQVVANIVRTQIRSDLEPVAVGELGKQFGEVLAGSKDLNTAFREAEEIVEIRRKAGQIK